MALQFAVLLYGGRWTMLAGGVRHDRYASRQSAVDAAHRLADQARRQGHEVHVLVQDGGGQLAEEPPAGEQPPP
jgi:hypothetical protein